MNPFVFDAFSRKRRRSYTENDPQISKERKTDESKPPVVIPYDAPAAEMATESDTAMEAAVVTDSDTVMDAAVVTDSDTAVAKSLISVMPAIVTKSTVEDSNVISPRDLDHVSECI